jgi:hypothetical protein
MVRLRVPDGKWAPAEPFRARAFAQPDRPLTTIHHMLGEVHPVDHQHRSLNPLSSRPISSVSLGRVRPRTARSPPSCWCRRLRRSRPAALATERSAAASIPPTPSGPAPAHRAERARSTPASSAGSPAPGIRPAQSWRRFLRNQTIAFSHHHILRSSPTRSTCACGLVLWVQPCVLRGCADCDGVRKALSLAQPSAAHNERSKSRSAVRSARSRRYSSARGGRLLCLAVHGRRAATFFRPSFRCEVHRMKPGRRHGRGRGRLKTSR